MKSILIIFLCVFLIQESMQKPSRKMKLSFNSVEEKGFNPHLLERLLKVKAGRLGCDYDIYPDENGEDGGVCLMGALLEFLGVLEDDGDISVEDTAFVLMLLYWIDVDLAELNKCKEDCKDTQKTCEKVQKYTDCVDKYLNGGKNSTMPSSTMNK